MAVPAVPPPKPLNTTDIKKTNKRYLFFSSAPQETISSEAISAVLLLEVTEICLLVYIIITSFFHITVEKKMV